MATFASTLKDLRTSKGLTQDELSSKLNIGRSRLGMYETGAREPDFTTLEAIADFFNVDMDYLMGRSDKTTRISESRNFSEIASLISQYDNLYPIETRRFPLLGEIACGEPKFADEDWEGYVQAGADIDADFCLRAHGDSMINARINDGDIVFIRKQDMVDNGDIAAVIIGDEATLKRFYYYREQDLLVLKPENPAFKEQVYSGEQLNQVRVLGRAVAFQSEVK